MNRSLILTYLARAHQRNPEAEVSGAELRHELGLDAATAETLVAELACEGLVEFDPLLANLWLRLTDKGAALAEREGLAGPAD